ncbi:MAG TPA: PAS domain-containing sensor histidine kinase [Xanthobacteraceae bacterium]|nr:PAS domain-containing sensor histidine kinase [Xanthobacteraceae bacterium]
MGLFAPIRGYIETLVHPSAQQDVLTAARHRAFLAPRLLGSVVALAAFPVYLLVRGAPNVAEVLISTWLIAQILTAYFLSRTGRYDSAHVLSSLALTGLVTALAADTGGIASFAAVWLVVVPLEAALSASRRVVATASTFALAAAGLLMLLGAEQLLPSPGTIAPDALAMLGIASAGLYATGLALGVEGLARTSFWLLYAEEDRYRLLARNIADVITRHGRDGGVLFVSPAAEALFGSRVGQLHGHGLFERVHVADRPAYLTALGDAAALGEPRSAEFRIRRDGVDDEGRAAAEFIWIEMRCRPLEQTDSRREVNREVVAVLRDVTERRLHQQALLDAHAETERANAAKSRFLATMSHELRTPLNAIIGFSDMLMKEQALSLDAARRGEYAGLINGSGYHLLSVVNGILDMSRIETGNFEITPEPFALSQVIAGCCGILALRARETGVRLEQIAADNLPEMVADKRALNQILLNLLSNAIRFTDRGGTVTVSARAEAAHIGFVVEDDGVGISDEDLARVGEPYFQAGSSYDRRHGGTGLGLSIVKGLVQLHGGELSICSRLGKGTRVTVRLPIDCERARPTKRAAVAQPSGVLGFLPAKGKPSQNRTAVPDTRIQDPLVKKSA